MSMMRAKGWRPVVGSLEDFFEGEDAQTLADMKTKKANEAPERLARARDGAAAMREGYTEKRQHMSSGSAKRAKEHPPISYEQ